MVDHGRLGLRGILLAAFLILGGCGSSSPPSTAPSAPPPSSGAASFSFTSPLYGYTLTVPGGWQTRPASDRWDGSGAPGHLDPTVDRVEPTEGTLSVFAFAAPTKRDLAGFTSDVIAANAREHGDTCPPTPEKNEATRAGGEPATFLAWNCGILINVVAVIHAGVGYEFAVRHPDIHAATDATDRATLDALLATLTFPA